MAEIWNLSTLCRCCHADGHFKSLRLPYGSKNDVEIFENMLRDTFGITMSTPALEASYTICDNCIFQLRDATNFKKQVLICEERFKVYCNNEQFAAQEVKIEANINQQDDDFDRNDDDFNHDNEAQIMDKHSLQFDVKKEYCIEVDINQPIKNDEKEEKPVIENINTIPDSNNERKTVLKKNNTKKRKRTQNDTNIKNEKLRQHNEKFLLEIKTESDTKYSCKTCGDEYETRKDIDEHITKKHQIIYKCEYCPKEYKSYTAYLFHNKMHTGTEIKCPICPKTYSTPGNLLVHKQTAHKEKKYGFQCDICQKIFKNRSTIIKHLKFHAGKLVKKLCDHCGRGFNDATNLNIHIKAVHEKLRAFPCGICGKSYSTRRWLRQHIKIHDGSNDVRLKCEICGHRVTCAKTMKIHKLKHENKYMCGICLKVFDDFNSRREHIRGQHHTLHTCHCGKVFTSKYSLNRHLNDHNGIKKFSCNVCNLKFSQKSVMNRHIFRKHNRPEFDIDIGKTKCDICKRSFKNIIVHMDSHINRSFSCEICGKTYPDRKGVSRHMVTKHYGRRFECEVCNKSYLQKAKLNTHKFKVHKIKIENVSNKITSDDPQAC